MAWGVRPVRRARSSWVALAEARWRRSKSPNWTSVSVCTPLTFRSRTARPTASSRALSPEHAGQQVLEEEAPDHLAPAVYTRLLEDAPEVVVHRVLREEEISRDLPGRAPARHELHYFLFAGRDAVGGDVEPGHLLRLGRRDHDHRLARTPGRAVPRPSGLPRRAGPRVQEVRPLRARSRARLSRSSGTRRPIIPRRRKGRPVRGRSPRARGIPCTSGCGPARRRRPRIGAGPGGARGAT